MNKVEAIQKSIKIWTWLHENPLNERGALNGKDEAYESLFYGQPVDFCECPLCEYAAVSFLRVRSGDLGKICGECPALGYWGENDSENKNNKDAPCQRIVKSPWNKWRLNGLAVTRKQAALEMVEMLNRVLADQPAT